MSFTDQKPFEIRQEHIQSPWSGMRPKKGATTHPILRCAWCGHKFVVGDIARWVYTNGGAEETKGISGNPFICQKCDGPRSEILAKLRAMNEEYEADRLWWFRQDEMLEYQRKEEAREFHRERYSE